MFGSIRRVLVLLLAGSVMWSCSGERVTTPQVTDADLSVGGPLSKPAVSRDLTKAVVVVTVRQGQVPVSGATVEFSRSVSGRAADYAWSGTTGENGQAQVAIGADDVSGYYQARAMQDGSMLGSWSSIPINGGYALVVDLPVGGKARVIGSSVLPSDIPEPEGLSGEISFGVALPLTGPDNIYGLPARDGFELAREEINGRLQLSGIEASIQFIVEDSRGTPEGGMEAFGKLVHQGVPVILGPGISTVATEAFPIAQENQVVALSSTSTATGLSAIGDFIFRVGLNVGVLVPGSVQQTQEKLGYQRVAMMADTIDVYAKSLDEALRNALADNNVEIVARETFGPSDSIFAEQLNRIKALGPDAIFVSTLAAQQPKILVQASQLDIPSEVPFLIPELAIDQVQAAGDAAEGAITFTHWASTASTPGNQAFVQRYTAKYGVEPSVWAALSYAGFHIIAQAILEAQSVDASAIKDAMAETRDLDTILGRFSFDADGDAVYDPIVLIVRDGKFEVFE